MFRLLQMPELSQRAQILGFEDFVLLGGVQASARGIVR
jgi:hypothetical protein